MVILKESEMDKKKWVKHLPLYILEVVLLAVCVCVLYFTLHVTDENGGVKKAEIKEENIVVNEEVKEKFDKQEEQTNDTDEAVYTGVFNIAFFAS